jgi:hypothetical protein
MNIDYITLLQSIIMTAVLGMAVGWGHTGVVQKWIYNLLPHIMVGQGCATLQANDAKLWVP